jgi:tRNA-splicing ligase RtcB
MDLTKLKKIEEFVYELAKHEDMTVAARIFANNLTIEMLKKDEQEKEEWSSLKQLYNVACLPGICKYALAMPDIHPGYGFPIGGVGAFYEDSGVISVAGVGFDINCGVRTMTTPLILDDIKDETTKEKLANQLFRDVPAGLGSEGDIKLSGNEIEQVLKKGAGFALDRGYGLLEDLNFIEEKGCISGADPEVVSEKAKKRGEKQIGTLGSGNHYLEVQYVDKIYDDNIANLYGLFKNQIVITFHCGSRGLGHQIGTDYLPKLEKASKKYNIPIRGKELVSAPITSPEGQDYLAAVKCGVNSAFANRQTIAHLTRKAFSRVMNIKLEDIKTLYEIGHNTVKEESHIVDGKKTRLLVHRKGSTRSFGPNTYGLPEEYVSVGQPVIVGGTMGTWSYILHGTQAAMEQTFGSACHGAGRVMSRVQSKKKYNYEQVIKELKERGILIKGHSKQGIAEEAPGSYKNVDDVIEVMHTKEIAKKVVRVKPVICIKG